MSYESNQFSRQIGQRQQQSQGYVNGLSRPGEYQGNLQTNFTGQSGDNYGGAVANYRGATSQDSDVLGAQRVANETADAYAGKNDGVDYAANNALLNMYKGRIQTKNALAEQIAGNEGQRKNEISSIYGEAGNAARQGTRNTRENFNSRGLLYSGMREGGENAVRSAVGSKMSSDISGTNREAANSLAKAKNAYASVGLQNAQENLKLADEAVTTSSKNNIARLQAYQQMWGGIGQAAGSIYGSYNKSQGAPSPQGKSDFDFGRTGYQGDVNSNNSGLMTG